MGSAGGRYRYQDDWQTPDTQVINIEFNNSAMTWEGRSCNGRSIEGSSVGVMFYGERGSLLIESGNSHKIYDLKNNLVKEVKDNGNVDARNAADPAQQLDTLHIQNFFDGIKKALKWPRIYSAAIKVHCWCNWGTLPGVRAAR